MSFRLNRSLWRRAAEKPVHIIFWKGWQLALKHARRDGYWQKLDSDIKRQIDRIPTVRLRQRLIEAPQLICRGEIQPTVQWLSTYRPEERQKIIEEAENCLAFRWNLLGSELHCQGLPVPWCTDWRVGYTWPRTYYANVDYSALGTCSDVKYVWELSRFYFAPTLGQAYQLTGDKKYRDHFLLLFRDWVEQNPIGWSINWCSALEVALRGVHLATAISFFPDLDDDDLQSLVHELAVHGAFLSRNIEYTDVRGNHYTGNLYGLLVLGCLLEAVVPEARRWRAYAERHICNEVLLQFYPDGVNIEKSIHYHRFVLDMFLYCMILLERSGSAVSTAARDRLFRALGFTAGYLHPNGSAPCVGDSDDGQALHLSTREPRDHRSTLALGSALFPPNRFPETGDDFSPECLWLLGRDCLERTSLSHLKESPTSFPVGGYLLSKGNGCYLLFDVGDVGQRGRGGHGHHDALSFELSLNEVAILVDPGMPTYTGDIKLRNRYRSTAAHNTAIVDGAEQGTLSQDQTWRLGSEAQVSDVEEYRSQDEDLFAARHHGFERLSRPVRYHRRLVLNRGQRKLQGKDTFDGSGLHMIQIFFHIAPGIHLVPMRNGDPNSIVLQHDVHSWILFVQGATPFLVEGEISPRYGVRMAVPVIEIKAEVELPAEISYAIEPCPESRTSGNLGHA